MPSALLLGCGGEFIRMLPPFTCCGGQHCCLRGSVTDFILAAWGLLESEVLLKSVATWEALLEAEGHLSPLPLPELPSQCTWNGWKVWGNTKVSASGCLGKWRGRGMTHPCRRLAALSACPSVLGEHWHVLHVPPWEEFGKHVSVLPS